MEYEERRGRLKKGGKKKKDKKKERKKKKKKKMKGVREGRGRELTPPHALNIFAHPASLSIS